MRLLVLPLCLITLPLAAAPLTQTRFAPGTDCYARVYDAAHLVEHPEQLTAEIALGPIPQDNPDAGLVLLIALRLRGAKAPGYAGAFCQGEETMTCGIEGDGGHIRLSAVNDGAVLLQIDGTLSIEGESGFFSLSGDSGDDRSFILRPADTCPETPWD